ncbi:DUF4168 domain-containing protein [Rhizobium sp. CNPSo 3464]|uniref:DUF4168 domain-containing protein n=1 Tax=Rhizobium sp. CNPSo 3464 TaxID=3021406 RepID=UPI00254E5AC0|nr:DUF4168 domain-containing protein [Rhizobium sp. CNPSo 3464]MDK4741597.1 DUF4168 domain-containing protein [Rhizobium sp. CNPSo 3464]
MHTRYTKTLSLTAAVFSLTLLGQPSFSQVMAQQQPATQQQPAAQGQTGDNGAAAAVSDQKIEAFAVAYLQVDKVRQEYSAKIGATPDVTAKQKLQTEASEHMVKAVEGSPGISLEEYKAILTAAQNDPTLAKRVQDKFPKSAPAQQ